MPQWKPRPGASLARASGEPIITASAPQVIAFETSPPVRMPPSAMTLQYSPVSSMCCERAAATSAIAVACGTPMPRTPRVVHAEPGPTPTSTPTAPVRMRCRPVENEAHPPTTVGTGTSAMNSLRFSGSERVETCSAEITVPWITRMSRPASMADLVVLGDALGRERCGGNDSGRLDLLDPLGDELGLQRLAVDLLHQRGGSMRGRGGDLLELGVGVLVARPDALEVQHGEPAQLAHGDGRVWG